MSRLKKLEKGMWNQDIPVLPEVSGVFWAYFHEQDLYYRLDPELNQFLEYACRDYKN